MTIIEQQNRLRDAFNKRISTLIYRKIMRRCYDISSVRTATNKMQAIFSELEWFVQDEIEERYNAIRNA